LLYFLQIFERKEYLPLYRHQNCAPVNGFFFFLLNAYWQIFHAYSGREPVQQYINITVYRNEVGMGQSGQRPLTVTE